MSLPMTAVGPLKVETKPILIGSFCAMAGWMIAGTAASAIAAPAASKILFFMSQSPPREMLTPC